MSVGRRSGRVGALVLLGALVTTGPSCDRTERRDLVARKEGAHAGVTEVEAGRLELPAAAGQTIYVPAYSAIATSDNLKLYQLAVTLGIRNTDRHHPIIVKSVRYHNQDGQLVREFLKTGLRIAPLATTEFFVRESDRSGGTAASFVVEWIADQSVSDPVVETVMVGTSSNQGISFTCPGRVVADRGR